MLWPLCSSHITKCIKKFKQYIFYNLYFISNIQSEVNMIDIFLKYNKEGINPKRKIKHQLYRKKTNSEFINNKKVTNLNRISHIKHHRGTYYEI
jgi:glycosylphosphatidylinositol transamidase (GPIT) subunit GPI8